jgi:murein DD-endopeptidase MepM/ murein hydrolase activator NlpD
MEDKKTGPRRGIFLILAAVLGTAALGTAMDWPAPEARLIRNFGWNDEGRPVLGNSFTGEGPILAAERGELLFSRGGEVLSSRLPSPLGSWLALDHGDGLISIYGRLAEDGGPRIPDRMERGAPLALMGSSGWSSREGFYFSLFDRRERRWINPSMIIAPFPDTRPPLFRQVTLRSAEGRQINPAQTQTLSQGRYTVLAAVSDAMTTAADPSLAPRRIVCSVNGAEIGALSFETLSARDGKLMVYRNGLAPAAQVYAPFPGFEVGEVGFTRGRATLEIIAQDMAGNSRSAVFRLIVE